MKLIKIFAILVATVLLFSCNDNDDGLEITGTGDLSFKFDNSVGSQDLILNTTTYSNSSENKFKVENVRYLISNIKLKDVNNEIISYNASENMFIIDEADANNAGEIYVTLKDVPAGDYKAIQFGIGVTQEQYKKGADGQGEFLQTAQDKGMMWSWQAGYRFLRIEGLYTAPSIATETEFAIHMGSHGSKLDNYKEVELMLPSLAKVRTDKIPEIHIVSDLLKIFDGVHAINLAKNDQIHVDPILSPQVATNFSNSFSVHHVHND